VSVLAPPRLMVARARTLSQFVSVQVAVQLMAAASGILLVRALSKPEYAYFTIANSMQATMGILADSGIGIGLSSIGGKVWQDRHRFGELINTALRLRRYLAVIAATAVGPILVWLLISNGASTFYAATITIAVLLALNYQLLAGVLIVVPRLHSQISRVQTLDAIVAGSRLLLIAAAYLVFLNAAVALFAGVVGIIGQCIFLRHWTTDNIEPHAPINREDRATMLGIIKHQAPNAAFYCVQGQLTVWLISVFGNTQSIAEVGALGRLSIIFSIINSVMVSIILPAFARYQSPKVIRRRYFQVIGGFVLLGLALISATALFPGQLLWILGAKYMHLGKELLLMMVLSSASGLIAAMWSLNSTRAWIRYSWLNIPGVILMQITLLLIIDVSTVKGVIVFGLLSLIPTLLLNAFLTLSGFANLNRDLALFNESK